MQAISWRCCGENGEREQAEKENNPTHDDTYYACLSQSVHGYFCELAAGEIDGLHRTPKQKRPRRGRVFHTFLAAKSVFYTFFVTVSSSLCLGEVTAG